MDSYEKAIRDFERHLSQRQQFYEELIHRAAVHRLWHDVQIIEEQEYPVSSQSLLHVSRRRRFLRTLGWGARAGKRLIGLLVSRRPGSNNQQRGYKRDPVIIDIEPSRQKSNREPPFLYEFFDDRLADEDGLSR